MQSNDLDAQVARFNAHFYLVEHSQMIEAYQLLDTDATHRISEPLQNDRGAYIDEYIPPANTAPELDYDTAQSGYIIIPHGQPPRIEYSVETHLYTMAELHAFIENKMEDTIHMLAEMQEDINFPNNH